MKPAKQLNLLTDLPALLEQAISSAVPISKAAETINEADDLYELITFWNAVFSSSPDACQLSFQFKGQDYLLEDSDHEDGHTLQIKNKTDQKLARFENASLEQVRHRFILLTIFMKLESDTQVKFQSLFDIAEIGQVDFRSPIVSADLDGSMARLVVLGIQAGIINIDTDGIELLAWLMDTEAWFLEQLNTTGNGGLLSDFQSNAKIQKAMEELDKHLTYKKGYTQLILIGDVLYDRFSCHTETSLRISTLMSRQGAKFINGNHDNLTVSEWGDPQNAEFDMPSALAFGGFAKNEMCESECLKYQQEIFSNAYYHKDTNKLYLHHGLEEKEGKIYTAFGLASYPLPRDDEIFDVEKFVEWINLQPRPMPYQLITDTDFWEENFQLSQRLDGFRPDDKAMKQLARKLSVEIVHGHTGNMDVLSTEVIVLNARKQNQFAVVAAYVGKSDSLIKRENVNTPKRLFSEFMPDGQLERQEKRRCIADSLNVKEVIIPG